MVIQQRLGEEEGIDRRIGRDCDSIRKLAISINICEILLLLFGCRFNRIGFV